ncbi:uncharacterized protein LOC132389361 isoform X2 [Hypanus sabinus]|uniref:uncharacterized protein LOC132389361 isoform X2 n=1 Tax=Hypanus sabinus TaxID=79690 RepID=UPI0028C46211|nr:uncharacterized protein LOC132389361 isoform X2 [Hypanus sabinus]
MSQGSSSGGAPVTSTSGKDTELITPVLKMGQGASSGGVPVMSTSGNDTEQQKLITSVLKMSQGSSSGGAPVTSTSGKDTELITPVLKMGQGAGSGGVPVMSTSGNDTEQQKLITSVLKMSQGSSSGGAPVTSTSGKDTELITPVLKMGQGASSGEVPVMSTSGNDTEQQKLITSVLKMSQGSSSGGAPVTSTSGKDTELITPVLKMGQGASSGGVPVMSTSGNDTEQQKQITAFLKMGQGASSGGVPVESSSGKDTELPKLITPVLKMGQGASSGGVPVMSTSGKDTGVRVITELLAICDNFQLLQLTDFYRDRLEQAMEGGVHGVSLALTAENQFSGEEHRKISDLADKGERADSSKLLLSLVMEKGSRAPRVMWETFVKMRIGVPDLDKVLKEIQMYGPGSVITELLASWDDSQLLQLTDFYRDRLEQAMEGGVHGVRLALTAENQFSGEEHRKISDLDDEGKWADSSKLLLSLVMEKGSRARRVMWETFVKMRIGVPKFEKILKEIQIYGCDSSHRPIPAQKLLKVLSELKELTSKETAMLGNLYDKYNRTKK